MPLSLRGRDEEALQSRRRTDQRATSQDAGAEAPQCAESSSAFQVRPPAGKETEVARLTRELNEAREQQTATSEVLQVISSFAGELDPVFQAILANATRICEAKHGTLFLFADGAFQPVAAHGASAALAFERLSVRTSTRYGPRSHGQCKGRHTNRRRAD